MTRTTCPECEGACLVPCENDDDALLCTRLSGEKLCGRCGGLGYIDHFVRRGVTAASPTESSPAAVTVGLGSPLEVAHGR